MVTWFLSQLQSLFGLFHARVTHHGQMVSQLFAIVLWMLHTKVILHCHLVSQSFTTVHHKELLTFVVRSPFGPRRGGTYDHHLCVGRTFPIDALAQTIVSARLRREPCPNNRVPTTPHEATSAGLTTFSLSTVTQDRREANKKSPRVSGLDRRNTPIGGRRPSVSRPRSPRR